MWFVGGSVLGVAMACTAMVLGGLRPTQFPPWWYAGVGFIGVELLVHLFPHVRGRASFYDGNG